MYIIGGANSTSVLRYFWCRRHYVQGRQLIRTFPLAMQVVGRSLCYVNAYVCQSIQVSQVVQYLIKSYRAISGLASKLFVGISRQQTTTSTHLSDADESSAFIIHKDSVCSHTSMWKLTSAHRSLTQIPPSPGNCRILTSSFLISLALRGLTRITTLMLSPSPPPPPSSSDLVDPLTTELALPGLPKLLTIFVINAQLSFHITGTSSE